MKVVYTRRAVFTALRRFLDDADLMRAMIIWQEKYANKPTYAFTQFLSECCQTKELKRSRPSILSTIFKNLELPESELLPDPFNRQKKQFDILVSSQVKHVEANHVFVRLVDTLLDHLDDNLGLKIRAYLMKHVGVNLKLNTLQAFALKTWMHQNTAELSAAFDRKQKQTMVNMIYVALCEYVGPVKADQLLALSVKEIEPLANAHQVDLHDYL